MPASVRKLTAIASDVLHVRDCDLKWRFVATSNAVEFQRRAPAGDEAAIAIEHEHDCRDRLGRRGAARSGRGPSPSDCRRRARAASTAIPATVSTRFAAWPRAWSAAGAWRSPVIAMRTITRTAIANPTPTFSSGRPCRPVRGARSNIDVVVARRSVDRRRECGDARVRAQPVGVRRSARRTSRRRVQWRRR